MQLEIVEFTSKPLSVCCLNCAVGGVVPKAPQPSACFLLLLFLQNA